MRIFLKITSGFLCAFFPLYIVQWLSAYYIEFPVNLVVAVVLLVPFYFIARKICDAIDYCYIDKQLKKENEDMPKTIQPIQKIDTLSKDASLWMNIESQTHNVDYQTISQEYKKILDTCHEFHPEWRVNYRQPQISYAEHRYLEKSAHNDIKTQTERHALLEYHKLNKEKVTLTNQRKQIKKEIDDFILLINRLKHCFVMVTEEININASELSHIECSPEITEIIEREKSKGSNSSITDDFDELMVKEALEASQEIKEQLKKKQSYY